MSEGTEDPRKPTADALPVDRRSFLQLAGFAVSAAALNGCTRGLERQVVPYLVAPEEVIPGRATWYASVCGACPAGCGVLAKALDGRPVKLEGNPDHPLSAGGLCALGQASVLGLYDSQRLRSPLKDGVETDWSTVDSALATALEGVSAGGGRVRFLTDSTTGPAERAAIEAFLGRFADGRLVTYDPVSLSAIADAHQETHGLRSVPRYRLDRAEVIVSVGADFLGPWISPVEHTRAYRAGRRLDADDGPFSHHVQLESRMTLTGSNADHRVVIPPRSAVAILAHLAARVARDTGSTAPVEALPPAPIDEAVIDEIAGRLLGAHRGSALVLCGDNDLAAQRLTNFINQSVGSYGGTVDLDQPSRQRAGSDAALLELRDEVLTGSVDAVFVRGVNPVYDLPFGAELAAALGEVDLVVSFAERLDETAQVADFVCPEPHFLETWGDSEPAAGIIAVRQPVLRVLGDTRPLLESIAAWSGTPGAARDLVREAWRERVFPRAQGAGTFDEFWNQTLHDGWAQVTPVAAAAAGAAADGAVELPAASPPADGELVAEVHPSPVAFDGRHAHNPWLLELPDPVSKTVWDNFAALAAPAAQRLGVADGDEVEVSADGVEPLTLPVLVQPGQHPSTVAIALGWGRQGTERFAEVGPQWLEGKPTVEEGRLVGANAAPLVTVGSDGLAYSGRAVTVRPTGVRRQLARTQMHHSLDMPEGLARAGHERRTIVRETTLADLHSSQVDGGHGDGGHGAHGGEHPSLYAVHEMETHHWGMVVDLTACTGCSACVVACQAENNVPVVGRDEVARAREMHWMRIDRYYNRQPESDPGDDVGVDVVHMPMMCQHCDNAPCENVCPVQATAQSAEGLNQQIYNRCVGTRYCANNCPYKVRRFNWFDYPREDRLQNMTLNPDVTVRSRGVMEKCSLCVQRIQEAKAEAKQAGLPVVDGAIQPACAQSCPAGAIVFGDMNDPQSRLSILKQDRRHYAVLDELGVKPVVGYLAKVRNRTGTDEHT